MKMINKDTKNIEEILRLFKELDCAEFLDDEESRQTSKIFAIIELIQIKNKDRDFKEFDRLIDEIMELKRVMAEKYLKIGVAYVQSKEGV